ncbi:MAG: protein phosphatase 2C domain-containing protein, partial [Deltaproteobacteria bacterium]|nr:protein phosphatase 2C domain-containing protein [Deltaproteobacteria bacterium]
MACAASVEAFLARSEAWHARGHDRRIEDLAEKLREAAGGELSLPASDPRFKGLEGGEIFNSAVFGSIFKAHRSIPRHSARKRADHDFPATYAAPRDRGSTLMFAAFRKFRFGWFFSTFWAGDGGMCLSGPEGSGTVKLLGIPDSVESAARAPRLTAPTELTPYKIRARTFFSFPQDFEALIMATGGVTGPFFPSAENGLSEEHWRHFWSEALYRGSGRNPGCPELFNPALTGEEIS